MCSLSMEKWVNSLQITFFIVFLRESGDGGRDKGGDEEEDDVQVLWTLHNSVVTTSTPLLQSYCLCVCLHCCMWGLTLSCLLPFKSLPDHSFVPSLFPPSPSLS